MLQRYFDGSTRPVAPHIDDIVECSDGTTMRRADAIKGLNGYHSNDDDRYESDKEFIHAFIDDHAAWACEYAEHDDYGGEYAYLAQECPSDYARDEMIDYITGLADVTVKEATDLADELLQADVECQHECNEYASWKGDGVSLFSFSIGEIEHQVDLADTEWYSDYDKDELENILAAYNGDACISCYSRYNKETGKHERGKAVRGNCLTLVVSPGGQWVYYIPGSTIRERVNEYLERDDD